MIAGFEIRAAKGDADLAMIRELFLEYQDWLGVDLCFQDFEAELAALPGMYAPPRGRLFLVFDSDDGRLVGCVALRPRDGERAEMKRLYVRPDWRRRGLGRHLTELCLAEARDAGYRELCLDTLAQLHAARTLYRNMGFREIEAYYENPLDGVTYMALTL
jgi:ribosomal protein S18 acetylase RimI-like enzyme